MYKSMIKIFIFLLFFVVAPIFAFALPIKGIYLSQNTLEMTSSLDYLIENAKKVGINTFVIDLEKMTDKYQENIKRVKEADLRYVVRIVMFPGGGTNAQIKSRLYWQKKLNLIEQAISMGADEVQLDYIRYNTQQPPSEQNAKNILRVIQFVKQALQGRNIPLQIDVFGISSFKPSRYIGQDISLFASSIDALCPMLYPSHFEPYRQHALTPYKTVFESLQSIKKQVPQPVPFKIYTYIELFNYRYPYSQANRLAYIQDQIRASEDAGVDGWYAWSARNNYDKLFELLKMQNKPRFNANLERRDARQSAKVDVEGKN